MKKKLGENGGMSLIEVLIAAAILAVASLMLFMAIHTMTGIAIETEQRKTGTAALSASIAYGDPAIAETSERVQFSVAGIGIRGAFITHTTEEGQSFTVFEAQR